MKRVTLLDVAKHAGVSRATASLVVRDSPLVGAATRAKVEAAMAELGYVYNLGAARMRAARSRTVGVIIPNLTNPFFAVLLAGIESTLETAGLAVILANSNENAAKQDGFVNRMREHGVDGLIVCPAEGTERRFVDDAGRWGVPLVQTLRMVPETASDYAGMDPEPGMREAVVLVATDYEFHELETNWVSSAQSYMNHAAYQYQRPDIGVFLNVAEYDDSKMHDLSNDARKTSEPFGLFREKFPAWYLDSKNADIAVYLGGNDKNAIEQGESFGYGRYPDDECRYTWSQMVADIYPPIIGLIYDGSLNARRYCVIHELGHIFDANHEDSQGTNKAYMWVENNVQKRSVMWSCYLGATNTCEYSSPSYHGDNTHDNAGAIRAVKHNIAALV